MAARDLVRLFVCNKYLYYQNHQAFFLEPIMDYSFPLSPQLTNHPGPQQKPTYVTQKGMYLLFIRLMNNFCPAGTKQVFLNLQYFAHT